MLSKNGRRPKRTLFQKLHAYRDAMNKDSSQLNRSRSSISESARIDSKREIFQAMLRQALEEPIIEEKHRASFNPRDVKTNKSLLLKKLHTRDKMAILEARKAGLHLLPGIPSSKNILKSSSVNELHKKAQECGGNDLSMFGLSSPVNIRIPGRDQSVEQSLELPVSMEESYEEDYDQVTVRRKAGKIIKSLDQLMRESRYKVKKDQKPKFDFDQGNIEQNFCDTHVDEYEERTSAQLAF